MQGKHSSINVTIPDVEHLRYRSFVKLSFETW